MQVPSVMFMEMAVDSFKDKVLEEDELKELQSFGDARAQQLGASGLSTDFQKGYLLGLNTARVVLVGSVALAKAGIKWSDLL